LRLLTLPESIQKAISENLITFGHAKAILSAKGKENQERLLLNYKKRTLSKGGRKTCQKGGNA